MLSNISGPRWADESEAGRVIRLHQLRLPLDVPADAQTLAALCAERLRVPPEAIAGAALCKRSVDARDKRDLHFALSCDVRLAPAYKSREAALLRRFRPNEAALTPDAAPEGDAFALPVAPWPGGPRPVVVGAGPAGLFCALGLALRGARPILLERGKPVEARALDVEALCATGALDPESNVLFGEGGAGAFSDGKLTCGLNAPRMQTILRTLVACGAPEDILYDTRPHVGTDVLRGVLAALRQRLISLGCEPRFQTRLDGLRISDGRLTGLRVRRADGGAAETLDAERCYLAIGHSARDTYAMLRDAGLAMERKPFAIGVRIEHLQSEIDRAQYGALCLHPALPPADYKLSAPTPDGRGAYTFCMCPGGRVIPASQEDGCLNVNGMSDRARDGRNANAALLVGVRPDDYGSAEPLAGVAFQRRWEQAAYRRLGGLRAPCQRVEDFLAGRPSAAFGDVLPSYRPGVEPSELAGCLPDFALDDLRLALPLLDARLRGFAHPDALLTGVELRSSAPVRLLRDPDTGQGSIGGLYPLGEGAGYAGGIMSAALDGLGAALRASGKEAEV